MRPDKKGRAGTIMVTPPKSPANDSLSPLMRSVAMSAGLLAFGMVVALSLPTPRSGTAPEVPKETAKPEPVLTAENAVELCHQLFEEPKEYIDGATQRRRWDLRREAASQGSADAYHQLYEHHRSRDRGDLDKVPLVTRAEAAQALHKAAELGHPFATRMLVRRLEDGDIIKRDIVAARYWAERSVANPNPTKHASKADLLLTLGRLLATSDKPDERARGLEILEKLSASGHYQYGVKTELALAIRKEDPVRARTLLEESRRPDPGGAIVPLAEMLIAGEGGPADPKRALSLLKGTSDSWMAKGMLGQLTLEGKLVPRDIQEAVNLIDRASTYDFDARMQVVRLLAEYPETRVRNPKITLYYATEAAELDEPGAMKALIELKLSANAQFQDRPGACKLIETAVSRGDQSMAQLLADCRAN